MAQPVATSPPKPWETSRAAQPNSVMALANNSGISPVSGPLEEAEANRGTFF